MSAANGVWGVSVALAIVALVAMNRSRLGKLRESVDARANAPVLGSF